VIVAKKDVFYSQQKDPAKNFRQGLLDRFRHFQFEVSDGTIEEKLLFASRQSETPKTAVRWINIEK